MFFLRNRSSKKGPQLHWGLFYFLILNIFFWPLSSTGFTSQVEEKASIKGVQERSQALVLSGQPQEAMSLLLSAALSTDKDSPEGVELRKTLSRISVLFLSERTQKLFELGQSLYFQGQVSSALERFREAQSQEPHNLQISSSLVRALIQLDQCSEAMNWLEGARKQNPFLEDLKVLYLKNLLCLQQKEEYPLARAQVEAGVRLETHRLLLRVFHVEWLFSQGLWTDAMELAQQVIIEHPDFPETHYWLWRISQQAEGGSENFGSGQRYISLCKSLTSRVRRTYKNEPRLCAFLKDVEQHFERLEREQRSQQ